MALGKFFTIAPIEVWASNVEPSRIDCHPARYIASVGRTNAAQRDLRRRLANLHPYALIYSTKNFIPLYVHELGYTKSLPLGISRLKKIKTLSPLFPTRGDSALSLWMRFRVEGWFKKKKKRNKVAAFNNTSLMGLMQCKCQFSTYGWHYWGLGVLR